MRPVQLCEDWVGRIALISSTRALLQVADTLAKQVLTGPGNEVTVLNTEEVWTARAALF